MKISKGIKLRLDDLAKLADVPNIAPGLRRDWEAREDELQSLHAFALKHEAEHVEVAASAEAFLSWFKEFIGRESYAECLGEKDSSGSPELKRLLTALEKVKPS